MNKLIFALRIAAASVLASPLWLATAALAAEGGATFSRTEQSDAVQTALSALHEGSFDRFVALLDDEGRSRLGSQDRLRALRARLGQRASSVRELNFRTHLSSRLRPDTHLGWVSNREYVVDVHGPDAKAEPILVVSVHCLGISLMDSFGGTDKDCRVSRISERASQDGSRDVVTGQAGVTSLGALKQLGDDGAGTSAIAPSAARAIQ